MGVARLAMWRACGPLAGGTPALPGGGLGRGFPRAWASPAWRCGGPAARLRAGRPRSQGVALGAMGFPESVGVARLAMWRACGPLAGGTPALPGGGPVSDVPGSAGILPATGRRPAKRRQERHARAGYSPARGAQCRRGRSWVPCRGRALEEPESVGVARLAMWRACGPLAGGTPALPGGGLGSDGVSRERGCRPLGDVAGLRPACGRDARAPRGWPWE